MAKQYEMERVEPENELMNVGSKDSCRVSASVVIFCVLRNQSVVVIVHIFMCIAKPKCSDISGLFSSLDWFIFFHSCSFGVLDEVHAAQGPSIVVDKMLRLRHTP